MAGTDNAGYVDMEDVALDDKSPHQDDVGKAKQETKPLSSSKLLVVACILITELCERLTYYSVVANTVLYATSVLKYSSTTAANITTIFSGVVYLMPIIGGVVADLWSGKFRAIIACGFVYILGLVMLPLSAFDYRDIFGEADDGSYYDITVNTRRSLFMSGMAFIAIGTGGIKANVGPFGAQQLEEQGEGAIKSFFNWFYWFINVGALIAYTAVAYIQQEISFGWGFVVPLGSMILAIILFLAAKPFYVNKPPGGSVLADTMKVIWQVMAGKKAQVPPGEKKRVFDKARKRYGGSFDDATVESVKAVLRILPVFLAFIMYWAIYSNMTTTFLLQGERLDVQVGSFNIPASGLNAFNTIIIIVLIPIVDRVLYPFLERIGRPLSHLQRIGIGFVLAAASVVVAGIVEIYRKDDMMAPGGWKIQKLGGEKFNASTMSVFVQVPEYALVGASEVFASICGLEFAYTQAPKSMQGVLTGLFLVTSSLGGFLATGILNVVKSATESDPWFDDEINNAKVEYYFFLLGGLMMFVTFIYFFIAKFYRYRDTKYDDIDGQDEDNRASTDKENTQL